MKDQEIKLDTAILAWKKEFPKKIGKITQSLLQRWLREKHNINVESNYLSNIQKYKCLYIPMNIIPKNYKSKDEFYLITKLYIGKINHDNYEQALEEGLYKALELI